MGRGLRKRALIVGAMVALAAAWGCGDPDTPTPSSGGTEQSDGQAGPSDAPPANANGAGSAADDSDQTGGGLGGPPTP